MRLLLRMVLRRLWNVIRPRRELQIGGPLLLMSKNTLTLHLSNRILITLFITHLVFSHMFSTRPFTTQQSLPFNSAHRPHHNSYPTESLRMCSTPTFRRRIPLDILLMKKSWKWTRNSRVRRKKPGMAGQKMAGCEMGWEKERSSGA